MFDRYIHQWQLKPDGPPIVTHSSQLLPVMYASQPAMLKVAVSSEEKAGAQLMVWWEGRGAARVLAFDEDAILLDRATTPRTLTDMAHNGQDSDASRIICDVVAKLHSNHPPGPPTLISLDDWFTSLLNWDFGSKDILYQCASIANERLQNQQEVCVLHGDIHHGNILDFGQRGWLAIDPKGLLGDRCFEYANIFCNPDSDTATAPNRLEAQVHIVSEQAGLDSRRLLEWTIAYCGLSAVWCLEDGQSARTPMTVAQEAIRLVD